MKIWTGNPDLMVNHHSWLFMVRAFLFSLFSPLQTWRQEWLSIKKLIRQITTFLHFKKVVLKIWFLLAKTLIPQTNDFWGIIYLTLISIMFFTKLKRHFYSKPSLVPEPARCLLLNRNTWKKAVLVGIIIAMWTVCTPAECSVDKLSYQLVATFFQKNYSYLCVTRCGFAIVLATWFFAQIVTSRHTSHRTRYLHA